MANARNSLPPSDRYTQGQGRLMLAWSGFRSRLAALPERGNRRPGQMPALRLGRRVNWLDALATSGYPV
jgi:hypothetical protein